MWYETEAMQLSIKILVQGKSTGDQATFLIQRDGLRCYTLLFYLIKNAVETSPCILTDRKVFILFGIEDGLNKYTRYNVKVSRNVPENPYSWKMNNVSSGSVLIKF